ncbi:2TM domain-containing protein [Salinimicrobium xinjiangense]|uniref:2TM domain-containing protein n=1 Tax=Salinimicrobium xinjiangense TaxID=438596 RepID=UPI00048CC69C|nr:2TM domain-containing protein [Salinimicrobium xinjiangense]
MTSKNKSSSKIDPEQRELVERAQHRARQKRRLYQHFVVFLLGSVVLILINVIFEIGTDINPFGLDWFVWAIIFWALILLIHVFNVYVTNKFFGKDWENEQVDRLVAKQQRKIAELQKQVEKDHPLPHRNEPYIPPTTERPIDPDEPINS